jgi:hypothetical protein
VGNLKKAALPTPFASPAAALPAEAAAGAAPDLRPLTGDPLADRLDRLGAAMAESGANNRAATQALASLAEGIQGLVQHMRAEQQMIRDWVEAQGLARS